MIPRLMTSRNFVDPEMLPSHIPVVMDIGAPLTEQVFEQLALSNQALLIENKRSLLIAGGRHSIVKALKTLGNGARHIWVNVELCAYLDRANKKLNPKDLFSKTYTIVQLCDLTFGPRYDHCIRIGRKNGIKNSPDRVLLESLAEALQQEFASHYG